jgi:thiosulfate/3-mercaptopyruvate sulfurtransferase
MTLSPSLRQSNATSVDELTAQLSAKRDIVLLDVRFTPGKPGRRNSYLEAHLPGALYIDLPTELADPVARADGRGSNPLPDPVRLQSDLRRLGIGKSSSIVVYDDTSGAPAARAWWVLNWAGIPNVKLLDGGLRAWKSAGLPLSSGEVLPQRSGDIEVGVDALPFLRIEEAAVFPVNGILVDARPLAQFGGESAGHIPGAKSFPAEQLLGPDNKLLGGSDIADRLKQAGIDTSRPLAAYCGGGVASTLFVVALAEIGKEVSLYPGSWSEWTADGKRPIER